MVPPKLVKQIFVLSSRYGPTTTTPATTTTATATTAAAISTKITAVQ